MMMHFVPLESLRSRCWLIGNYQAGKGRREACRKEKGGEGGSREEMETDKQKNVKMKD